MKPVSRTDINIKSRPQAQIEPGAIFKLVNSRSYHDGGLVLIHDLHPSFPGGSPHPDQVRAEYLIKENGYCDHGLIWTDKKYLEVPTQEEIDIALGSQKSR